MVGNFQVNKNKIPHYIGAGLAFIIGTVYCTLASINIRRLYRPFENWGIGARIVTVLRYASSGVMIVSILVLTTVAFIRWNYNERYKHTFKKLDSYNFTYPNGTCIPIINLVPPYKQSLDLIGSCVEWLLMMCLLLGLSLYTYEFRNFEDIKLVLKNQNKPLSVSCVRLNVECAGDQDENSAASSPTSSLLHCHSDTTGGVSHDDRNSNQMQKVAFKSIHDNNNGRMLFNKADAEQGCDKNSSHSLPNLSGDNMDI